MRNQPLTCCAAPGATPLARPVGKGASGPVNVTGSAFAAIGLLLASCISAAAGDDRFGWGFCAAPYPPECVHNRVEGRPFDAACESAVYSYETSVAHYRLCIWNEMGRAVLEANQTVQIVKCAKDKRECNRFKH